VSKVTEKIKTRSKPTPSENFNSHPLYDINYVINRQGDSCVIMSLTNFVMQPTIHVRHTSKGYYEYVKQLLVIPHNGFD
jgi:hypothetical protein